LKEEEKTLEGMALVEMLTIRMVMVGSMVGTLTLKASGSSCRSATFTSVTFYKTGDIGVTKLVLSWTWFLFPKKKNTVAKK
jgi:hypothetical protein